MMSRLRFVIIGAGAAGMAAGETIRAGDPQAEIVLVSEEPENYYSRPGLAYYLTGELTEKQLFPMPETGFKRLNIQRLHARAERIDSAACQVIFQDGRRLAYDRLLIATGSSAARVNMPNMDAEGVVKLDNLADARQILKLARKSRRAVVVGGGITAVEIVEGLLARGLKPDYFLRGDRYWSNVLDETESRIVEHRLSEDGVRIHYHTELAEVVAKNGRLAAVRTRAGAELPCDLLGVAIGVLPQVELARASGLRVETGIWVDEYLQTSQAGVFAAGDVAESHDPASGKSLLNTLWPLAHEQGLIAGRNMLASLDGPAAQTAYRESVPFNVTRLAGLTTTIIGTVGRGRDEDLVGIARGDSETWRQLPDAIAAQSNFTVNRLRALVGESTLLGAIVMGDQTLSRPLQQLIARQVDVSPIRDRLLQPTAALGDILADFWSEVRSRLS
jgi:NAD(P)H-nitrite reductase large subunit